MRFETKKYDCCVIDFEIANNNLYSACSVGVVLIKDLKIVDTFYSLIKPPNNFYAIDTISVHGISPNDTINCSEFPLIWDKIVPYIKNSMYIAAHNAHFDMSVLCRTLEYYNLTIPIFKYLDTMHYKANFITYTSNKLIDMAKVLNIEVAQHHNALSDASTSAEIIINTTKRMNYNNVVEFIKNEFINIYLIELINAQVSFGGKNKFNFRNKFSASQINKIEPDKHLIVPELLNKYIVFSGEFSISRNDFATLARQKGAIIGSSVTKKTNYLIEGIHDEKYKDENGLVSKQRKAIELINDGINITRLSEKEFMNLLHNPKKEN